MVEFTTAAAAFAAAQKGNGENAAFLKLLTQMSDTSAVAIMVAGNAGAILDLLRNTGSGSLELLNSVIDSAIATIQLLDAEEPHKQICIDGLEELRTKAAKDWSAQGSN